jgi:hypothetical protein
MSDWTFLFTAMPLGIAVVLLAFAVTNALTHDRATTLAIMVAVASGVGYTIGRLDGRNDK